MPRPAWRPGSDRLPPHVLPRMVLLKAEATLI